MTAPTITPQQLADYQRDGAICVRNVIDMAWVEKLRAASARAVEAMLMMKEGMGQARPTEPAFHNVLFMHKFNPDFREIALDSPVARLAQQVMQSKKVILLGDHLLVKEPGTQEKTPWHHDLPYWPINAPNGEQVTSVWIALDQVTLENGSMEYVAGSHLWGRKFQPQGFNGAGWPGAEANEPMIDVEGRRSEFKILQWDLQPGDMLVHHPLILHGAGVNARKDINRRGLAIRYVGERVTFKPMDFKAPPGMPKFEIPLEAGDPLDKNDAYAVASL